jgi:phosphoribosylformylglycinamidine cyclo-ligase
LSAHKDKNPQDLYAESGVDTDQSQSALAGLLKWVNQSLEFRQGIGSVALESGHFANVINMGGKMGLALSTDGVGTKILIAQMMEKYDTVGIDCVAMNVNDILCVGAEPIAMLDYLAVQYADATLLEELGKGLLEGARQARISIPGGELAQLREMIDGERAGYGFDLVGMAVGMVPLDKVIVGQHIAAGDALIGLASSGLHSNGFTLARHVLLDKAKFKVHKVVEELGKPLGEVLLEPTRIYVSLVLDLLQSGLDIKAMAHITGDGLFNLTRVKKEVGYFIDFLPDTPPIFTLIQECGKLGAEEMFKVFNMGTGFCLIVPDDQALLAVTLAKELGMEAYRMGYVVEDPERKIIVQPKSLVGRNGCFMKL